MTPRCADQPYASHLDFYRDVYGHAIVDALRGFCRSDTLHDRAGGGDWSDAPTPDLVITVVNHHAGAAHIDLGHGSFSTPGTGSDYFVVVPPHASTNIVVDGDHSLLFLSVPYAKLLSL